MYSTIVTSLYKNFVHINVVVEIKEQYVSVTKNCIRMIISTRKKYLPIRFIDNVKFLPASLSNLSDNPPTKPSVETRKHFTNSIDYNLMKQNGIFEYSYVHVIDKLEVTTLRTKTEFLNGKHISDKGYARSFSVWTALNCQTLEKHSCRSLKTDVLIWLIMEGNVEIHKI